MIHIYDEDTYKYSDNICLSCEYDICSDCEVYNKNINKESDIENGESDTVQ